jgi:hypothetical protein
MHNLKNQAPGVGVAAVWRRRRPGRGRRRRRGRRRGRRAGAGAGAAARGGRRGGALLRGGRGRCRGHRVIGAVVCAAALPALGAQAADANVVAEPWAVPTTPAHHNCSACAVVTHGCYATMSSSVSIVYLLGRLRFLEQPKTSLRAERTPARTSHSRGSTSRSSLGS